MWFHRKGLLSGLCLSLVVAQLVLVHVEQGSAGKIKKLKMLKKLKKIAKMGALFLALGKHKLKPKFGILPIPIP